MSTATIEYESELRHKNEMARVQAEISGKLVFSLLELKIKRNWGKNAIRLLFECGSIYIRAKFRNVTKEDRTIVAQ